MDTTLQALAQLAVERRGARRIATAESFTAGLLAQALAATPHSSEFFRGGVVAYQSETKWQVLGVDEGPVVTEQAAIQMAVGVAKLLDADVAISSTGVAGPDHQDGRPPGTVILGWWLDGHSGADTVFLPGPPEDVVHRGARAALSRLAAVLSEAAD